MSLAYVIVNQFRQFDRVQLSGHFEPEWPLTTDHSTPQAFLALTGLTI
jgi:hypothetical protein